MTSRPTLLVVRDLAAPSDPSSDLQEVEGFDVLQVGSGTGTAGLVDALRAGGASRWLLVGQGPGVPVVTGFATEVAAGRVPVFGLAGVVLLNAAPGEAEADAGARDVPVLVVAAGDDAAAEVTRFWRERAGGGPSVPGDFAELIASDRVGARTRGIHVRRALADDPRYVPTALDAAQLATLRVVADRVVPQDDPGSRIDLAARVDAQLAAGQGDGWRHADLPADLTAYAAALDELADLGDLSPADQDAALTALAAGERAAVGALSGEQLALWFEDACNDLVRQWVAHPATMARIGYDGLANGGDGEHFTGYVQLGADQREPWEPVMVTIGSSRPGEAIR